MASRLKLHQGVTVPVRLRVKHLGAWHNLTGATLEVRIPHTNGTEDVVIPNGQMTIPTQTGNDVGKFTMALTNAYSALFKVGGGQTIKVKVTQGGTYFIVEGEGILDVKSPNAFEG